MRKRILAMLLSVIMVLTLVPMTAFAAESLSNVILEGDTLSWAAFDEASEYYVSLQDTAAAKWCSETTCNLKQLCDDANIESGTYSVCIYAVDVDRKCISDTWVGTYNYTSMKAKLESPTNIRLEGTVLKWDAVTNANRYSVSATENGSSKSAMTDSVSDTSIDYAAFLVSGNTYQFTVVARGTGYINSNPAQSSSYTYSDEGATASFTVTFDMNGHGTQVPDRNVESGSTTARPSDPKEASEYYFMGWYADPEFTSEFDFDAPITKNTTIYAKWGIKTVVPEIYVKDTGTDITVVKEGHVFPNVPQNTIHVNVNAPVDGTDRHDFTSDKFWAVFDGTAWKDIRATSNNTAVADGITHYGIGIELYLKDGYMVDDTTELYFNEVNQTNFSRIEASGNRKIVIYIDFGLAVSASSTPAAHKLTGMSDTVPGLKVISGGPVTPYYSLDKADYYVADFIWDGAASESLNVSANSWLSLDPSCDGASKYYTTLGEGKTCFVSYTLVDSENATDFSGLTTATCTLYISGSKTRCISVADETGYTTDDGTPLQAKKVTFEINELINPITIAPTVNGTVIADKTAAAAGEIVSLNIAPAVGYEVDGIDVACKYFIPVTKAADGSFVFTMPDVPVTVTVTFRVGGPAVIYKLTGMSDTVPGLKVIGGGPVTPYYSLDKADYYEDIDLSWDGAASESLNVSANSWLSLDSSCDGASKYYSTLGSGKPCYVSYTLVDSENVTDFSGLTTATCSLNISGYTTECISVADEPGFTAYDGTPLNAKRVVFRINGITKSIIVAPVTNGSVTADKTEAAAGETVTVTATPADGYELEAISAKGADGSTVTITSGADGKFAFTMPDVPVTVTASFKEIASSTEKYKLTGFAISSSEIVELAGGHRYHFKHDDSTDTLGAELTWAGEKAPVDPEVFAYAFYKDAFRSVQLTDLPEDGDVFFAVYCISGMESYEYDFSGLTEDTCTLIADGYTTECIKVEEYNSTTISGDKEIGKTIYFIVIKNAGVPGTTSYTISYDLNGGSLDGKTGIVTIDVEEGTVITLPAPTRDGYVFDYWQGSQYNAGATYTVTEDHTFTAQWKEAEPSTPTNPTEYTVTFNMNGHGTQVPAQTVEEGNKVTKPDEPSASGYTFDGWYADATFSAKFDFSSAINANTTVYAKWTEVKKDEPTKPADPTNPTQPTKPADPTSPQTGDNSHLFLWVALLFISGGALAGTAVYGKKRKYNAK